MKSAVASLQMIKVYLITIIVINNEQGRFKCKRWPRELESDRQVRSSLCSGCNIFCRARQLITKRSFSRNSNDHTLRTFLPKVLIFLRSLCIHVFGNFQYAKLVNKISARREITDFMSVAPGASHKPNTF